MSSATAVSVGSGIFPQPRVGGLGIKEVRQRESITARSRSSNDLGLVDENSEKKKTNTAYYKRPKCNNSHPKLNIENYTLNYP